MTSDSRTARQQPDETTAGGTALWLDPIRAVWQGWNRWWFEPVSTVPIGLFRIFYGAIILAFVALLVPDIQAWFGRNGPFTPGDADRFWGEAPHYSILLWFPSHSAIVVFFAVLALAAFCLMIGFWTRISAIVVFVGLVSIGYRNPLILHGGDTLLRLMAFYLVLAPAGSALSVDRLRALARGTAGRQPPLAPPWATRLLQLQVAFVYAMSAILKLKGVAWSGGTAIYYTSRLEEFHRFPMPFVSDSMLLVNLLTYWTLATELALAFLVWVPALRPFVLLNGVALHAGIEYSMNVPLFAFAAMISYITFINVEGTWQRILTLPPLRSLSHATLWVRTECRPCAATARVLLALDLFHRLDVALLTPPTTRDGAHNLPEPHLQLDTTRGRKCGFAALCWLSWRLPLLWPFAPLLILPGMDHVYRRVATHLHASRRLSKESSAQDLRATTEAELQSTSRPAGDGPDDRNTETSSSTTTP